jgi:hypothetical protein
MKIISTKEKQHLIIRGLKHFPGNYGVLRTALGLVEQECTQL